MNARERFLRLMRSEPVDGLPVIALEPFEQPAIERWRGEGLPPDESPVDFLGMDQLRHVPLGLGPIPPFEQREISEDNEYIVETSNWGTTVRRRKDMPTTFYGHIDHPVKTRADWERYKQRFNPDSPERIRQRWTPGMAAEYNACESPVGYCIFPAFFRLGFYLMGMERFLTAFHDEPDLVHDIFGFWGEFIMALMVPTIDDVRVDYALFNEDLAGKNGPLVSPGMYEEFWAPCQDPILRQLHEHDVPVVCQWSAGDLGVLLPGMLEHGFNCTAPIERTAGMDPASLRQRFGSGLGLFGGIPKEALIAGPGAIDAVLDELMPLIREGGFLPALDDMVPAEVPFDHYRHMVDKLRAMRLD